LDKQTENKLASFNVGDREYAVGYGFNDICDIEDVAGCNLLEGLGLIADGEWPDAVQLRGLLAAMIVAPPGFPQAAANASVDAVRKTQIEQLKYAGSLIRIDTLTPIRMAIVEACSLAVSDELGQKFREAMKKAEVEAKKQLQGDNAAPVDGASAVDATA